MKTKNLKKLLIAITAALSLTVMLVGCGSESAADKDSIKIGANLELTGNSASFGTSAKNGIDLAVKEVNDAGGVLGKKLVVVTADNRSEAAEAANAMQKLADDKVVAMIAPNTSSNALAGAGAVAEAKVPAISPGGSNPKVTVDPATNKVRQYMFRATFIDPFQGRVMANFATKSLNAKTAAIYIDNSSDYSKGLAQFFKEAFTANGGKIVAEEAFLQKDTDFKAALTNIKGTNPDVIFIPAYYQEVGMIVKQAREMGITCPLLGGDGWDSNKLAEIAGKDNLVNTFFSNHYSAEDKSPASVKFVESYKKTYNSNPDAFAALGYDCVMMIVNAIKTANSADPAKITEALAATKDFQGATGTMTYDANHDPIKAAFIMTFKDGNQIFKEKVAP